MTKNIYDIAREAKTSISTVSRYLNNKNVRPDTKERINLSTFFCDAPHLTNCSASGFIILVMFWIVVGDSSQLNEKDLSFHFDILIFDWNVLNILYTILRMFILYVISEKQ